MKYNPKATRVPAAVTTFRVPGPVLAFEPEGAADERYAVGLPPLDLTIAGEVGGRPTLAELVATPGARWDVVGPRADSGTITHLVTVALPEPKVTRAHPSDTATREAAVRDAQSLRPFVDLVRAARADATARRIVGYLLGTGFLNSASPGVVDVFDPQLGQAGPTMFRVRMNLREMALDHPAPEPALHPFPNAPYYLADLRMRVTIGDVDRVSLWHVCEVGPGTAGEVADRYLEIRTDADGHTVWAFRGAGEDRPPAPPQPRKRRRPWSPGQLP